MFTLVALLPSQTACEAPCEARLVECSSGTDPCMIMYIPVRDRRCIFEAACFAALAAVVVPTMVEDCLTDDVSAEEGDMAMYVLKPRAVVQKASKQCGNND